MKYFTEDQKNILKQASEILLDLGEELDGKSKNVFYYVDGKEGELNATDIIKASNISKYLTGSIRTYKV